MDITKTLPRRMKNQKGLAGQRVMAVRLVMEGYLGKDVAAMLNLCRQTVVFLCFLIQSSVGPKKPTGTGSVLNEKTTTRTKTNDLNPYTRRTRLGSRLFLEYLDLSIRNMVREDFNAKYNL
ncbi:hypothetical protein [Geobacillus thermodenitrificans]|jgi:hypothetical protein|uniref:hypothetical protein n=1 Tax=Geobacillus thermodenitrificans TaxID=33940 RepID=UPI003D26156C